MTRRLLLVLLVLVWPALAWAQPELRSGTKGTKVPAGVTSTAVDANTQALDVSIEKSVAISITGTVTITGALTDAQLRATPVPISGTVSVSGTVPVSGTFWQTTQPVSLAVAPTTPVTGTFWQLTQPISAASLPLPGGAATEATLATLLKPADTLAAVTSITNPVAVTGTFWQATQPVSLATAPTTPVTGTFWQATQPVSGTFWQATQPVSGTFWQATQPVSIATMPSTPVTGTFWQATQPVSGTFWQTTQPISGTVTANSATYAGKTLTYVSVNQGAAGTTALAGASVGNKHKLLSATLTMSLLGTLKFTDGVGDISGPMDIAATGGLVEPPSMIPYRETAATNRALNLVTTLGAARGSVIILTEP